MLKVRHDTLAGHLIGSLPQPIAALHVPPAIDIVGWYRNYVQTH